MPPPSIHKTPETKQEILDLYDAQRQALPFATETREVATDFGTTHVLVAGNHEHPPVVLLHGANAGAPVILRMLSGLVKDFRLFAVDIIGQPNRSAETRPDMQTDGYGKWLNQVIQKLGFDAVPVVATSFGGFVVWRNGLLADSRISRAVMINPAGIINGNAFRSSFRVFIPLKKYISTRNPANLEPYMQGLHNDIEESVKKFLEKVLLNVKMNFASIPLIKKQQAGKVKFPLAVIGGDQDFLYPGPKLIKKFQKHFPSLQENLLLKGCKHVPGVDYKAQIEAFTREFLARSL